MADHRVLLKEIIENHFKAQPLQCRDVDGYWLSSFLAVSTSNLRGNFLPVGYDAIDHTLRDVLLDRTQMVFQGISGGFAWLGHQIRDVDPCSTGLRDRVG